mgnify:FL=1
MGGQLMKLILLSLNINYFNNKPNTNTMNTQENKIREIVKLKYNEYKCLADGAISYRVNGNTRRMRFSKLYEELVSNGVTASPEEVLDVVYKYRSNRSRVNVNN